jgi:hypothetical protein
MRRFSIATIITTAILGLAAGPANAALNVGIEDEDVFLNNNSTVSPEAGYAMLDDLGISTMRVLLTQRSVQDGSGFDFSKYTAFLQMAKLHGVDVQVVLVGNHPRVNVSSFRRFAGAAAQALQGGVTFYSIWNEPNLNQWISGSNKGATYRRLYAAGYQAIKSNDPSAKILIGETSPNGTKGITPLKFIRQLACVDDKYRPLRGKRCSRLKSNGYAHHPYAFGVSPRQSDQGPDNATIGTLRNLQRALKKTRREIAGTNGIYLTEFGYLATKRRGLPESRRAAYLKQGYAIARHTRGVKEMVQYLLVQPPRRGSAFTTGVVSAAGDPLPSYSALKASVG